MESPAQVRHLRELAVARAERARADLETALREIELYDQLLALQASHSERTISAMQANSAQSLGVRIAAGRAEQSDSRQAQIKAGLTDSDVAKLTGYNRSTVCKWHNGSMKIPEDQRKLLAKHGIPAGSWSSR